MDNKCEVGGWIRLPKSSNPKWESYKEELTYTSPYFDDQMYKIKNINSYIETEDSLYVPRKFMDYSGAIDNTKSIPIDTVFPKQPDPNHPKVKNPDAQKKFMDDLYNTLIKKREVLACAVTGTGKTVCALSVIPKLREKTIVLVHTEDLKDQWISEIEDKLGLSKDQIGVIQANKNTSKDKPITIALMQTLARRDASSGIFDDFGFVIMDEAHRIATEFFNDVIAKFPARYRLALTATPTKKDKSDSVLYHHFGDVSVLAVTEVMPVRLFVHKRVVQDFIGDNLRVVCYRLRRSKARNQMLAEHIIKAYNKGRHIIAVSSSVEHIQVMRKILEEHIPESDIGQLTASKIIDKKSVKVSKEERDLAKTKRVILATDGLVREGLDIPRLDMGIDLEPFWNATQRVGRIRRYEAGKKLPYWITVLDQCKMFDYDGETEEFTKLRHDLNTMFASRLKEYKQQLFEIVIYDGK